MIDGQLDFVREKGSLNPGYGDTAGLRRLFCNRRRLNGVVKGFVDLHINCNGPQKLDT